MSDTNDRKSINTDNFDQMRKQQIGDTNEQDRLRIIVDYIDQLANIRAKQVVFSNVMEDVENVLGCEVDADACKQELLDELRELESQKSLLSKEKPYICPQCGEDDRGSAEHAWYAHTLDGLEGKPYPYKESKVERR